MTSNEGHEEDKRNGRLWLIVCAVSVAFLIYSFVIFLLVGDKGPANWDFGVVPDTPGNSSLSITADQTPGQGAVEEQHVEGRPIASGLPPKEKAR